MLNWIKVVAHTMTGVTRTKACTETWTIPNFGLALHSEFRTGLGFVLDLTF